MNKLLYWIRNILFLLILLPFMIFPEYYLTTNVFITFIFYPLILILIVLFIKQHIKNNKKIKYNNSYNLTCIYSFIFMLIVILRALFDTFMIAHDIILVSTKPIIPINTFFISNNMIYFIMLIAGLIIYDLILTKIEQ